VLPARAQDLIRPLVRANKADVLAHLARHRLPFAEDPSNGDAAFLRVRVRRELLPLLEDLSPQIVRHLNALADALSGSQLPELGEMPEAAGALQNRAQIREALRAARLGRQVTIRVAGAREVVAGSRKSAAPTTGKKPRLSAKPQRKV
jgi:tRNA(Ile)-lysidine synthase